MQTLDAEVADVRNLMINFLPSTVTDAELLSLFAPFGELVDCRVVRDKITGESRGFGFATYAAKVSGQTAVVQMNGYSLRGKRLKVTPAQGTHARAVTAFLEDRQAGRQSHTGFIPRVAGTAQFPAAAVLPPFSAATAAMTRAAAPFTQFDPALAASVAPFHQMHYFYAPVPHIPAMLPQFSGLGTFAHAPIVLLAPHYPAPIQG